MGGGSGEHGKGLLSFRLLLSMSLSVCFVKRRLFSLWGKMFICMGRVGGRIDVVLFSNGRKIDRNAYATHGRAPRCDRERERDDVCGYYRDLNPSIPLIRIGMKINKKTISTF